MTRSVCLAVTMGVLTMTTNAVAAGSGSKSDVPSVQERLDEAKAGWSERASDETKAAYTQGIDELNETGIIESALNVGDMAPDFTLPNATGDEVSLSAILEQGPAVLTWYRGGWCPYCNIQLRTMQEALPHFEAAGGQLVAISPETPDNSLDTKDKNELAFEVLSDVGSKVAHAFGIAYELPEVVQEQFKGKLDLAKHNTDEHEYTLPLSATYVVGQDGKIAYAFLDAEYRNRAEPKEIIEVLETLK